MPPRGQRTTQESSSTVLWECTSLSVFESCHINLVWEVESRLVFLSVQVLQGVEREKTALLERLCQTQVELHQTRQQLGQLRQQVKEEQENGQVSPSSPVTERRAVTRACKVGLGTEEGRAAAGPESTEPCRLQR